MEPSGTKSKPTNYIPCGFQVVSKESKPTPPDHFLSSLVSSHSSLDTLSVNLWLDWKKPDFYNLLDLSMSKAQEIDLESVPVDIGKKVWNCHRFAPGYFKYHVSMGDLNIYFSKHAKDGRIANCKIDIGSLSCWAGSEKIFNDLVSELIKAGSTVEREVVGRVDMCCDHVGVGVGQLSVDNEDYWICRATKINIIKEHRKLSYVAYGKGNMMLRIYDKVMEMKTKKETAKQNAFSKIWGIENYDDLPVTRTEFQVRRKVIREFESESGEELSTVSQLHNGLQSLWGYACGTWARHNSLPVDRSNKNQKRSRSSSYWNHIQSVKWKDQLNITRKVSNLRANTDALKEQMRGLLVSIVSSEGLDVNDYQGIMEKCKEIVSNEMDNYMVEEYSKFHHKYIMRQNQVSI